MNLERFSKLFDLTGRVAVVTGGAQGNGQAIANALDDAGATVIVTDIVYGELSHGLHESITDRRMMNVTDEAAVEKTMRDIFDRYGKLDILINNAGIMYKEYIYDLDIERFKKVLDVNLHGTVICTKHASKYMKQQHWGRIVNIASSQTYLCSETYSAYAASKSAISHLTRIWGNELAPYNVLVNGLCPCFGKTPMMEASIERVAQEKGLDYKGAYDYFAQAVPLKRILELDEVANWVIALCGELGDASTGCNFAITCGQVQL